MQLVVIEPLKTKRRTIMNFKMPAQVQIAAAAVLALIAGGASSQPPPVVVQARPDATNVAELTLALKAVKPGATILLAPGHYGALDIQGLAFAKPVTIKAKGALFDRMMVRDVDGLVFDGFELNMPAGAVSQVWNSRNVTFRNISASGPSAKGVELHNVTNGVIENSVFRDLTYGVILGRGVDLRITGNSFRGMFADGIQGAGSRKVLIDGNDFADFNPAPGAHPDAIQFFTAGTTASAEDITITNNKMRRGAGGLFQGIFLSDQVTTLPYKRLKIAGNDIEGAMYNGIAVYHGEDVEITGNRVQPLHGQQSWIFVAESTRVHTKGNAYWRLNTRSVVDGSIGDKPTLAVLAGARR